MTGNKLIILDRDGVINEDSDAYVKSSDEWIPLPGSIEAIAKLHQSGYVVAVATNQSGIGRGLFDLDQLEAMHDKFQSLLQDAGGEIAGIFYCPHTPEDLCNCRKPHAGLVDAIEQELGLNASGAFFLGDSLRDLQAATTKHCKPVLVKTGKGSSTLKKLQQENHPLLNGLEVEDDLLSFTNKLLDK